MTKFRKGFTQKNLLAQFGRGLDCRSALLRRQRKIAFTLAEVLITLAIIGVVAALTIPTLWAKIDAKHKAVAREVIEDRLLDGLNRYNTMEDGFSKPYQTTEEFLQGLSKYYKMSEICTASNITKCIPYSTINYGEDGAAEVASLTSIDKFIEGDAANDYLPPASFITAQGTPFIIAFKKDCAWDTGKAMRSITDSGCIAYMYDENGTRNPNKLGKDIVAQGLTIVSNSGATPIATVGGYKIMEQAFFPSTGLTKSQCEDEISGNYGITECYYEDDYWAWSMKYCHDKGYRLPNETESLAIVNGLFKDSSGNHPSGDSWSSSTYKIDLDLVSTLGLKNYDDSSITQSNVDVNLWGSVQDDSYYAYLRGFGTDYAGWYSYYDRNYPGNQVLCLE